MRRTVSMCVSVSIPGLNKLDPKIPGLQKWAAIAFRSNYQHSVMYVKLYVFCIGLSWS